MLKGYPKTDVTEEVNRLFFFYSLARLKDEKSEVLLLISSLICPIYPYIMKPWHLKYRPQKISDLTGQENAQTILTNLISRNEIPNALLLAGPKGTGKTSTARIISMALNCKSPLGHEPCGECDSCKAIQSGNNLDVVEIDASSNNGVDDIRELCAKAGYAPINGKYKVYIIDEVHRLSKAGQDAFLKTLEEPPSNTIFLLATTEPNKLLDTIVSRCMTLRFSPLTISDLTERIKDIASKESVNIEEEALKAIAHICQGGLRDAIQLLYLSATSSASQEEPITDKEVYSLAKQLSPVQVAFFLKEFIVGRSDKLIKCVQAMAKQQILPESALPALLKGWVDVYSAKMSSIGFVATYSFLSESQLKELTELLNVTHLQVGLRILEEAEKRLHTTSTADSWFLATLLTMVSELSKYKEKGGE